MTIHIITIAEVPEALAQKWLQHLRDFDTAHPGCHFKVVADAPDMTMGEMMDAVKLNPPLPFMSMQAGGAVMSENFVEIDDPQKAFEMYGIREHEGYVGAFTTRQCPLARFDNGTRVVKVRGEAGDMHASGTRCVVLGSMGVYDGNNERVVGYFVAFEDEPKSVVFIQEFKLGGAP